MEVISIDDGCRQIDWPEMDVKTENEDLRKGIRVGAMPAEGPSFLAYYQINMKKREESFSASSTQLLSYDAMSSLGLDQGAKGPRPIVTPLLLI